VSSPSVFDFIGDCDIRVMLVRGASSASERATHMKRAFNPIVAAIMLVLSFAAPVVAGQFEDATAAYQRGDSATALRLFRPLADQGKADAQYNLGFMYANGLGVGKDFAEAAKWYRLAADQGNAHAQFGLGIMYYDGRGVPEDDVEAAKWYRLAADQGVAVAQSALGFMYDKAGVCRRMMLSRRNGIGSQPTTASLTPGLTSRPCICSVRGCRRTTFSHTCGSTWRQPRAIKSTKKLRDSVEHVLTPEQIAEAQKLAREWKPTTQPTK